jgi:hypothetical protein
MRLPVYSVLFVLLGSVLPAALPAAVAPDGAEVAALIETG